MSRKIGIFGGTFSPIHEGHIGVASEMLKHLDEVRFVITKQNPFKTETPASFEDRLEMVKRAMKDYDLRNIYVYEKEGPVYMVDYLKECLEKDKKNKYCLIIGWDSYLTLKEWKDYEWIIENIDIYVYKRGGLSFHPSNEERVEHIHFVDTNVTWNISSTEIREEISKHRKEELIYNVVNINGLSPSVTSYIGKKEVYPTRKVEEENEDRKAFIEKCSARCLAAMFSNGYWNEAEKVGVERAYRAANKLADLIFGGK